LFSTLFFFFFFFFLHCSTVFFAERVVFCTMSFGSRSTYDTQSGKAALGVMSRGGNNAIGNNQLSRAVGVGVAQVVENDAKQGSMARHSEAYASSSSSSMVPASSGSSSAHQDLQQHAHAQAPPPYHFHQQLLVAQRQEFHQPHQGMVYQSPYGQQVLPVPAVMIKRSPPPQQQSTSPTPIVPCTALDGRIALAQGALTSMRNDLDTLQLQLRQVHGQNCVCSVCADVTHMITLLPEMDAQFKDATTEIVGVLSSTAHGTKGPGFKRAAKAVN
jgi:hypothetical protein